MPHLTIEVDSSTYEVLSERANERETESTQKYVASLLRKVAKEVENNSSTDNSVTKKLENLGYL